MWIRFVGQPRLVVGLEGAFEGQFQIVRLTVNVSDFEWG
jgi:hypothetical protein